MKILKLVFRNIKKMLRFHPFCFLAIILGITVSSFGILYYTGQLLDVYYCSLIDSNLTMKIQIESDTNANEIKLLLQKLEEINKMQEITLFEKEPDKNSANYTVEDIPVIGLYSLNNEERILLGRNFEKEENKNNLIVNEAMVSMLGIEEMPIEKRVKMQGQEYSIVGMVSYSNYNAFMVPIYYYMENYDTQYIVCSFSEIMNKTMIKNIKDTIKQFDFIKTYQMPQKGNPFLSRNFMTEFIQVVAIFTVAMLNILTMMSFWVKQSRKMYSVYTICGCNKKKNRFIIMLQVVLLSGSSILLGSAIFAVAVPILQKRGLMEVKYSMDFIKVIIMLMIGAFLFAIRLALKECKEEKIYMIKE